MDAKLACTTLNDHSPDEIRAALSGRTHRAKRIREPIWEAVEWARRDWEQLEAEATFTRE